MISVGVAHFNVHLVPLSLISVEVAGRHHGHVSVGLHVDIQLLDGAALEAAGGQVDAEALEAVVVVAAGELQVVAAAPVVQLLEDRDLVVVVVVPVQHVHHQPLHDVLEPGGESVVDLLLREIRAVALPVAPAAISPDRGVSILFERRMSIEDDLVVCSLKVVFKRLYISRNSALNYEQNLQNVK